MILFDTSVLIDARDQVSPWHQWAKEQIAEAVSSEGAAANTAVVSEASVRAKDPAAVPALLEGFGMTLVPLPVSAAVPAARAFAVYLDRVRREGKATRSEVPLPDFFIGAHAQMQGWKLVTRDPDRVRNFFYITNRTDKVEKIVGLANGRCNQENVIEQLKNGVNAMRMPMADPVSNWAYVITSTLFLQEAQVLFDFLEVDFDRPTDRLRGRASSERCRPDSGPGNRRCSPCTRTTRRPRHSRR